MQATQSQVEFIAGGDGASIAIERFGKGRPLLLVHGTTIDRPLWQPLIDGLADSRQVIMLHRRGRLRRDDPGDYGIDLEFADIASAVEHLGEPADIIGHSYGALCVIGASSLTSLIEDLVLYEPPLGLRYEDVSIIDRIEQKVRADDLSGALEIFYTGVIGLPPAHIAAARTTEGWARRLSGVHAIPREMRAVQKLQFCPDFLRQVNNRTLLLLGEDSPEVFRAGIRQLGDHLPNAETNLLPGQKHQAIDNDPALFLKIVKPFLRQTK